MLSLNKNTIASASPRNGSGMMTPSGTNKKFTRSDNNTSPGRSNNNIGKHNNNTDSNHHIEEQAIVMAKMSTLEKDIERRQESYVARERAYKQRIDELETEVDSLKQKKVGWMKNDVKVVKLKQMQTQILSNIELVQDRTARILQEQEKDLLKAFRARLYDVQTELEKVRIC